MTEGKDEATVQDLIDRNLPQISTDGHDSLRYHLLGPSLTKAGQDSVDQQKVWRRTMFPVSLFYGRF